jgi:hypothetical protein
MSQRQQNEAGQTEGRCFQSYLSMTKQLKLYQSLLDITTIFFFVFDGTAVQCGHSSPLWTSPSQLCFQTLFRISNFAFIKNLIEMTNKMQLCRTIYYSFVP